MSFIAECVQDSLLIWEKCLNSPFLQKLETGTLEESSFLGYIIDDSLYLREYAKVFAWGMIKARTMEDIHVCYSLLSFINEGEGSTRLYYLHRYGLEDADIQNLPQRPENKAYTDCMLETAINGGMIECLMVSLPCMISYHWIFRKLLERSPDVKKTPYWPLVWDYASEDYLLACRKWTAYADQLCADLTSSQKERCLQIFRDCSVHELHFWEMSNQPRSDLIWNP